MSQVVMRSCSNCGEEMHPADQFCGNCGVPVSGVMPGPSRRKGLRVAAALVAFLLVAAVSGLTVAFIDARRDTDSEREKLLVAQTEIVRLNGELQTAADPDAALRGQLAVTQADLTATEADLTALQADLTRVQGELAAIQSQLTAERDGRATDAAAAQTKNANDVAAVQTQLDAVHAELDSVRSIFPLDEAKLRSADPVGDYAVTIQALECTIVECLQLTTLSITIPSRTSVSGNRANGSLTFADGTYASSGVLASQQAPLCNGVETQARFDLTFQATGATLAGGALALSQAIGTYRETITGGDCIDQFRAYSISMMKQ